MVCMKDEIAFDWKMKSSKLYVQQSQPAHKIVHLMQNVTKLYAWKMKSSSIERWNHVHKILHLMHNLV